MSAPPSRPRIRYPTAMKRTDLIPLVILLPLLGFVAAQVTETSHPTPEPRVSLIPVEAHTEAGRLGIARHIAEVAHVASAPARASSDEAIHDLGDVRQRLALGASGTYIDEILLERDSALARWPDRTSQPIRVWIGSGAGIPGWSDSFPARVRDAFEEWSDLGMRPQLVDRQCEHHARVAPQRRRGAGRFECQGHRAPRGRPPARSRPHERHDRHHDGAGPCARSVERRSCDDEAALLSAAGQ